MKCVETLNSAAGLNIGRARLNEQPASDTQRLSASVAKSS